MVRSMIAGVAGLKTHQSKLDVIGNNIANSNTYGFKSSRATFRDMYYQQLRGDSSLPVLTSQIPCILLRSTDRQETILQEEPEEEMLPRSDMELQPDRSLHRFRQALRRRPQVLSIV